MSRKHPVDLGGGRRRRRTHRGRRRLLDRACGLAPSFFPGHEAGSDHHHIKHGIAAFLVGVALLVYAWFQTGGDKKKRSRPPRDRRRTLITYAQAIILGLLQGVTELFPISSLGHSVILPQLFGWDIHQNDDYFITFLVATHLATAIVLFLFFWRDWMRIFAGMGRSLRDRGIAPDDTDAKLGWLLVVGTIPAGILGLLLEHALRRSSPRPVRRRSSSSSTASCCSAPRRCDAALRRRRTTTTRGSRARSASAGVLRRRRAGDRPDSGFSRSGATMARRSPRRALAQGRRPVRVLLATPIIGAAALLKLPELWARKETASGGSTRRLALLGADRLACGRFLMRYFETRTLIPFAVWCVSSGFCSVYFPVD